MIYTSMLDLKRLFIFIVFVGCFGFFGIRISETLQEKYRQEGLKIIKEVERKQNLERLNQEKKVEKGKTIFEQLKTTTCEELNVCWVNAGYINGEPTLSKEFPTTWGSKKTLIIPENEWFNLSAANKKDLGEYLKFIGVEEIITGRIKSSMFSQTHWDSPPNTLSIDDRVWSSSN